MALNYKIYTGGGGIDVGAYSNVPHGFREASPQDVINQLLQASQNSLITGKSEYAPHLSTLRSYQGTLTPDIVDAATKVYKGIYAQSGTNPNFEAVLRGQSVESPYTIGPAGNQILKSSLENFVAPGTPTPLLTQAQLNAQNAARGISQVNPNPAPVGSLVSAPINANAPKAITLGNGQVVYIDTTGRFSDKDGNPITSGQIASAKTGTPFVTSAALSSSPITYKSPTDTTTVPSQVALAGASQEIADLQKTQSTLGPTQTKLADLVSSLGERTNALLGKETYQQQENTAFGVESAQKTKDDLLAQQRQILAENAQIQLQTQQGQGVTTAIDQRQRNEALRVNAVKSLSISSLLAAADANLANAQSLADRAVKLKYAPIEEEIRVKTLNLNILKENPNLTLEDKKRTDAQSQLLKYQELAIANAKKEETVAASMRIDVINDAQSKGRSDIAAQAMKLNLNSPSFIDDVANLQAQIPVKTSSDLAGTPTSYKEWQLAGQPGTYADWLKEQNVKAPTVAQQTVSTYATRLEQANPTITGLEKTISGMNPIAFEAKSRLPSYLQGADFQKFDQAARNFINATLRRESGAVISPSEFDNAYKQYLPRSGDTAETLAEKRKNRDIVYKSFKNAAGTAYQSVDELLGTTPTPESLRAKYNY